MRNYIADATKNYREALEELMFLDKYLGQIARSVGEPFWTDTIDRAAVSMDVAFGQEISFLMNPAWAAETPLDELAGAIAHETYHLGLNHLVESQDPQYTDADALIRGHESIINDTIEAVHKLVLPPDVIRGSDVNMDFTPFSTRQAYDFFAQPTPPSSSQDESGEQDQAKGGQGNPDSSNSQASENQDGDSGNANSGQGSESETGDDGGGSGQGEKHEDGRPTGACGGFIGDSFDPTIIDNAVKAVFENASTALGITLDELLDEVANSAAGGYSPFSDNRGINEAKVGRERMAWYELLNEINPKILEAGTPRKRMKSDWSRAPRALYGVYPKVVLPRHVPLKPRKGDGGDTMPVFVIALDLSGSIDRRLVNMLQGMLEDIPEELIRAFPCTWADYCVPYEDKKVTAAGGTNINSVHKYVEKVKAETGVDPYVLCITDGEYRVQRIKPGRKWFYMGVDKRSVDTISKGSYWSGGVGHVDSPTETVYCVNDFIKAY